MAAKVWMFHYVRPENSDFPFLKHFKLDDFRRFLDIYQNDIRLHSAEQYLEMAASTGKVPDNGCVLTFDDGLIDHYKWVFPELVVRGLTAFFFINTLPFVSDSILPIHQIHLLYSKHGYDWLESELRNLARKEKEIEKYFRNDQRALESYPIDLPRVAYFKYTLNYLIPVSLRDRLIGELFSKVYKISPCINDFYMNLDQIQEMSAGGMIFGYHGHSHTPFSLLDPSELQAEISSSNDILSPVVQKPVTCLSYPFGDESSIDNNKLNLIERAGIKLAFTSEISDEKNLLKFPRTDCVTFLNLAN